MSNSELSAGRITATDVNALHVVRRRLVDPELDKAMASSTARIAHNLRVKRRVVLLGCPGSGKTSLTQRFVESTYDNAYYPTISQTFRSVTHEGEKMFTIEILDMAGLDSSSHIPRRASLGVHGYLLVYNIASFASFKAIKDINANLLCALGNVPDIPRVLVGAMSDRSEKRQVSASQAKALAQSWSIPFVECSAKDDLQCEVPIKLLMREVEMAQRSGIDDIPQNEKCSIT